MKQASDIVRIEIGPCPADEAMFALRALAGVAIDSDAPAEREYLVPGADADADHTLLETAPRSLGPLAAWFQSLTREQLASVWAAAIIEAVLGEGVVHLGALNRALLVVKWRLLGGTCALDARIGREGMRHSTAEERRAFCDALVETCRANGGAVIVREHFPSNADKLLAKNRTKADERFEWVPGDAGHHAQIRLIDAEAA